MCVLTGSIVPPAIPRARVRPAVLVHPARGTASRHFCLSVVRHASHFYVQRLACPVPCRGPLRCRSSDRRGNSARPTGHRARGGRRRIHCYLRRLGCAHHSRRNQRNGSARHRPPLHRLVVPRVLAATTIATLLNSLVITVGLVGDYLFGVYLWNVSEGMYLATLTTVTDLPEVSSR